MSKFGGLDWMLVNQEEGKKRAYKDTITESAIAYLSRGNIPPSRAFSTRERDVASGMFSRVTEGCLARVTIGDKLFVVAHADETEVGPDTARSFAGLLKHCGLKQVGLVTFKACNVGTGQFLDEFIKATVRMGIVIGWAKGYTGSAATVLGSGGEDKSDASGRSRPTEEVSYKRDGREYVKLGDWRVKIVRGPLNPLPATGRYT